MNHNAKIVIAARQTYKCFVEITLVSAYAWNAIPIDGTDIIRSIPEIGRPLRFPMDIYLANLPTTECDAAQATISYIRQISSDTRFAKELVTWLIEGVDSATANELTVQKL